MLTLDTAILIHHLAVCARNEQQRQADTLAITSPEHTLAVERIHLLEDLASDMQRAVEHIEDTEAITRGAA
jgi:hypothetical protein